MNHYNKHKRMKTILSRTYFGDFKITTKKIPIYLCPFEVPIGFRFLKLYEKKVNGEFVFLRGSTQEVRA